MSFEKALPSRFEALKYLSNLKRTGVLSQNKNHLAVMFIGNSRGLKKVMYAFNLLDMNDYVSVEETLNAKGRKQYKVVAQFDSCLALYQKRQPKKHLSTFEKIMVKYSSATNDHKNHRALVEELFNYFCNEFNVKGCKLKFGRSKVSRANHSFMRFGSKSMQYIANEGHIEYVSVGKVWSKFKGYAIKRKKGYYEIIAPNNDTWSERIAMLFIHEFGHVLQGASGELNSLFQNAKSRNGKAQYHGITFTNKLVMIMTRIDRLK